MNIFRLMRCETARRPLSAFIVFILSFCAACGLTFVAVLAENAPHWSQQLLGLEKKAHQITVLPAEPIHLFGIGISKPRFKTSDLEALRTDPAVKQTHIIHGVPVPATVHIKITGITDNHQFVTLTGLEPDVFRYENNEDLIEQWQADSDENEPVPIVINSAIVRFYNLGMADRYELPRLDKDLIIGREFDMHWGIDKFKHLDGAFKRKIRVVGFSQAVSPWGIGIPQTYAKKLLDKFFPNEWPESAGPRQVRVEAKSADQLAALKTRIEQRKLRIPEDDPLFAIIERSQNAAAWIVMTLMFLVAIVAIIALGSIFTMICIERRRQIALYRQFGAKLIHLMIIFFGGLGSALFTGILLACLFVRFIGPLILSPALAHFDLPQHVIIPDSLEFYGLTCGCGIFLLSSFFLWRLRRMNMLKLLQEHN